MHASTLLLALLPIASAWKIHWVSTDGHTIDSHGTLPSGCVTLNWNPTKNIKHIDFDTATANYPDPKYLDVFTDKHCQENWWTFTKGSWNLNPQGATGSYMVYGEL
ncbi:hypothetical protein BDV96DRAFT_603369 [Lophiotrema nucula]|uniref:Uncharacterized protein n=1 Tax=Lophiotrema nucula TaxID=690887 RepID=A0A6A5YVL6_9PLEO|nr:hypothetical protein BDV96DRAFT_603369 [Lophiotrema nucula]